MDTVEGLRDVARQARECAVIGHAVTLARWIGNGRRPVTAGQVLRKADIPAADADALARAVADFAASGAPRSIDQVAQLKVSLTRFRPSIWRRVLVPATATLGDLHVVIQVLFGWDGDHLHLFQVGKKQYADQFTGLEGTGDEEAVRVHDVLTPGAKIGYTYDFGADWEHEITLEQTTPRDPGQDYPVCVAFRGDSPVEYWCEAEPEEPEPFGLNEVNRRLLELGGEPE